MCHKKVPVFCKTTTVQRKFCVPFPCPFRSTYFRVYFCCVGKIILRTWNGEKTMKITLYVHRAGARKLLISKELPISKNGDGVYQPRQAPYFSTSTTGKLSSDHFEAAAKRRNKSELARDLKVFAKVQTKLHNR